MKRNLMSRTQQFKKQAMILGAIGICCISSGCITQAVTAPAQVASQSAQTAGQTAGQAAQVVTLNDSTSSNSGSIFQARATESGTTTVKKTQRNNL